MAVNTAALSHIGSIAVTDLIGMCAGYGDGVPSPLWRTEREPYWGDIEQNLPPFALRFTGDLAPLREWAQTYAHADIWVQCRVNAYTPEIADRRILAHRCGESGFLATQQPAADVVDVYRLSPLELGAAVAAMGEGPRPGTRPALAIPGYLDNFTGQLTDVGQADNWDTAEDDDYSLDIYDRAPPRTDAATADYDDVQLLATVQSWGGPEPPRGLDWTQDAVVWLRIDDDGDYVYSSDYSRLTPLSPQGLHQRIDELIAADVTTVRRRRGLS